jgi:HK97 family phage major capsid protein
MPEIKVKSDDQLTRILDALNTYEEKHEAKLNEMRDQVDSSMESWDAAKARLEALEDRGINPDIRKYESPYGSNDEQKTQALRNWLVDAFRVSEGRAPQHYTPEEMRADQEGNDTTVGTKGGHTVPTPLAPTIERIVQNAGVMRGLCRNIPMTARTLDLINENVGISVAVADVKAEGVAGTARGSTFTQTQMVAKKVIALNEITTELLEDSGSDIAGYLLDRFGEAIAVFEDTQFLKGDITGNSDAFDGVTKLVTQAAEPADHATVPRPTYEDIVDLIYTKVNENLMGQPGTLVMHPSWIGELRKLRDESGGADTTTGSPMWAPFGTRETGTILGFPYVTTIALDSVATVSASDGTYYPMVFGDFSKALIGNRRGYQVDFSNEAGFTTDTRWMRVLERVAFTIPTAYLTAFAKMTLTNVA